MKIVRKRGYARAGLIGNPSDGYHGKTISLIIRNFYATVILYEWENIELLLSQEDHSRFESVSDLVSDVEQHGYYGGIRLVKATIKKFVQFCAAQVAAGDDRFKLHDGKFAIRYESNIPRQVGLAGSSAIIVATLRALMEFYGIEIERRLQPSLVLSVERDELGISAGLQDRVIQVYEGLVYMDFAVDRMESIRGFDCGHYESIDPDCLPPMYVAYGRDVGEPTEKLHNPLRSRFEAGDEEVVAAMQRFAELTVTARSTLMAGEHEAFAKLVDANFDLRQQICPLDERHVEMVEAARSVGASAKYAGSGGAIVGTYRDDDMFGALQERLTSVTRLHCAVVRPRLEIV